jgi:hypothetical protein
LFTENVENFVENSGAPGFFRDFSAQRADCTNMVRFAGPADQHMILQQFAFAEVREASPEVLQLRRSTSASLKCGRYR